MEPGRPRRLVIRSRRQVRGGLFWPGVAAACLALNVALAGCAVAPLGSATSIGPTPPPIGATPAASPSALAGLEGLEFHAIDARFVPEDALVSADGQILWSGAADRAVGIWRFVPGDGDPQLLFQSSHPDAHIPAIAASAAGYAFIELSAGAYGEGGWRLWFLSSSGAAPVEVDRGRSPNAGVAPTIALDDRRLAWASFDEPAGGPRSRLRVASIADLQTVTTILDAPIEERLLWYPALSGAELWYGTIKADFVGTRDPEFHLEHVDLTNPGAAPVRFAGIGLDFNAVLSERYLAWKTNEQGDSALNWGTLHVLDRGSGDVAEVPIEHVNRPSLGDRFVAFDEISHVRLAVFDLETAKLVELGGQLGDEKVSFGGASLSGSLLTFSTQAADGTGVPRIRWAMLPESAR